jgi:hypothetical protein
MSSRGVSQKCFGAAEPSDLKAVANGVAKNERPRWRLPLVTGANPVTAIDRENSYCRRRIKMSPLCQLQMTLLGDFRGALGVTIRLMSDGELSRLEVLRDLDQRRLTTGGGPALRA